MAHLVVLAGAVLLTVSVLLILITWLRGRARQLLALAFSVVAVPVYLAVYWDRLGQLVGVRGALGPIAWLGSADEQFRSSLLLAWLIVGSYVLRAAVFLAVRYRPRRIDAPIEDVNDATVLLFGSFTLYSTVATAVTSVYHLGWIGAACSALIGAALWVVALEGLRQTVVLICHIIREPIDAAVSWLIDGAQAVTAIVVRIAGARRAGDSEALTAMTNAAKDRARTRRQRGDDRHKRREQTIIERHRRTANRRKQHRTPSW